VTVTETPHQSAPVLAQPQDTPLADSTIEVPPILSGEEGVEIYLTVHQRAWVRVTVDDEIALVGRVLPGSAYPFSGESQIEILTGNGWGIQVYYNGNDEGRLGNYGQVVNVIYTREGLVATPLIMNLIISNTAFTGIMESHNFFCVRCVLRGGCL
jgi:hypothetical protein